MIADEIGQPNFVNLIQQFLYVQHRSDSDSEATSSSTSSELPEFRGKIGVCSSVIATFFAPSDISGIGGMQCERIRAINTWRNSAGRFDCVFVSTDPTAEGMRGFDIARVKLFFSLKHEGIRYPCALIHWYSRMGDSPDENTGMWVVQPDICANETPFASIVHLDAIFRAAHLLPVYGNAFVPSYLDFSQSLDAFHSYYVNKYVDHHAFEIAF
jgi:hypothetical protein